MEVFSHVICHVLRFNLKCIHGFPKPLLTEASGAVRGLASFFILLPIALLILLVISCTLVIALLILLVISFALVVALLILLVIVSTLVTIRILEAAMLTTAMCCLHRSINE